MFKYNFYIPCLRWAACIFFTHVRYFIYLASNKKQWLIQVGRSPSCAFAALWTVARVALSILVKVLLPLLSPTSTQVLLCCRTHHCLRMYLYALFLVSLFSLFFLLFYFFVQDHLSSMAWSLLWIPSLPDGALPFPLNSQSSWQLFPWQLLALLFKCLSLGYKEQWDIALMACQRHFSQCLIHRHLPSVFWVPAMTLYSFCSIH